MNRKKNTCDSVGRPSHQYRLVTTLLLVMTIPLLMLSCSSSRDHEQQPVKKVLFAIVDGIPADVIERVHTPWIDSISALGGYTRAFTGGYPDTYSETPTISAVCYANLVTGVWVNKHNVWNNSIDSPNYYYPTVFRYLKDQYPDRKIALFSTWQDNRTKLVGEGKEETGGITIDFYADGYELDTVSYPPDSDNLHIHRIDERVSKEAAQRIRDDAPDLSWVYLQYTDDVGHIYGDSPQMDSAVMMADNQVGRLWEAVKYREANFNEEWLVYVVTDHGRDDKGYSHGGQSPRERGIWFSTNDKHLNRYFHGHQPALVDVMPSILRFLGIEVPRNRHFEWDGIPLSGPVSHIFTAAAIDGTHLLLEWEALKEEEDDVKIWLSITNDFKTGGVDEYVLLDEVPLKQGKANIDVTDYPSDFYKIVLETGDNVHNRWVSRNNVE